MAKRLKNLKIKNNKKIQDKYKCQSCFHYYTEYEGCSLIYNECLKKEGLACYDIEKQKFCKKFTKMPFEIKIKL